VGCPQNAPHKSKVDGRHREKYDKLLFSATDSPILMIYTVNQKPFGRRIDIAPYFIGQVPPKPPFWGMNKQGIFKPNVQNIQTFVIFMLATLLNLKYFLIGVLCCFVHVIKSTCNSL